MRPCFSAGKIEEITHVSCKVRYTLGMNSFQALVSGQPELQNKYQNLVEELNKLQRVAVAFSGGVDSALLLKIA